MYFAPKITKKNFELRRVHGHFSHLHTLETNWPTKWEPFITIKRIPMSHQQNCVCNVLLINFHTNCSFSGCGCGWTWRCECVIHSIRIATYLIRPRIVCVHFTAEILYPVNLSIRWAFFFFVSQRFLVEWLLPDDMNQSLNRIEHDSCLHSHPAVFF